MGVESKVVLEKLKEMGEFVKSASSTVELPVEMKFKKTYGEELAKAAAPAAKAPAKKAAAKTSGTAPANGTGTDVAPAAPIEQDTVPAPAAEPSTAARPGPRPGPATP